MAPSEHSPEAKAALDSLKRPVKQTSEDEHHTTEALAAHPPGHWMNMARREDHSEQRVRHT